MGDWVRREGGVEKGIDWEDKEKDAVKVLINVPGQLIYKEFLIIQELKLKNIKFSMIAFGIFSLIILHFFNYLFIYIAYNQANF